MPAVLPYIASSALSPGTPKHVSCPRSHTSDPVAITFAVDTPGNKSLATNIALASTRGRFSVNGGVDWLPWGQGIVLDCFDDPTVAPNALLELQSLPGVDPAYAGTPVSVSLAGLLLVAQDNIVADRYSGSGIVSAASAAGCSTGLLAAGAGIASSVTSATCASVPLSTGGTASAVSACGLSVTAFDVVSPAATAAVSGISAISAAALVVGGTAAGVSAAAGAALAFGADSNAAYIFNDGFASGSTPNGTYWQMEGDIGGSTYDDGTAGNFIVNPGAYHNAAAVSGGDLISTTTVGAGTTAPGVYLKAAAMGATADQVVELLWAAPSNNVMRPWILARFTPDANKMHAGSSCIFAVLDSHVSPNTIVLYGCIGAGGTAWNGTTGFYQIGSTYNYTAGFQAGDLLRVVCSGSQAGIELNGTMVIPLTNDAHSVPNGVAGIHYDTYGGTTATHHVPYLSVMKGTAVSVTGLSSGMYVRLTDGTRVSDAAWSSGTLVVPLGIVRTDGGCTAKLYQGNPASGGTLLAVRSGVFGGMNLPVN